MLVYISSQNISNHLIFTCKYVHIFQQSAQSYITFRSNIFLLKQNIIFQRNDDTCKAVLYKKQIKHVSDNTLTPQNYISIHYLNRSVKVYAFLNMKYLKCILCNSANHIAVHLQLSKIKLLQI